MGSNFHSTSSRVLQRKHSSLVAKDKNQSFTTSTQFGTISQWCNQDFTKSNDQEQVIFLSTQRNKLQWRKKTIEPQSSSTTQMVGEVQMLQSLLTPTQKAITSKPTQEQKGKSVSTFLARETTRLYRASSSINIKESQ